MQFSKYGNKYTKISGISSLMRDLGSALSQESDIVFMGGGNPAHIDEVYKKFSAQIQSISTNEESYKRYFVNYQSPEGNLDFRIALSKLLSKELGYPISEKNIGLSNGSQSAFYTIFNILAGEHADGKFKSVLLPMIPEYIGYSEIGIEENFFKSQLPKIKLLKDNYFKYEVDFDNLEVDDGIGAICVSRPTNPSGNMLTKDELGTLDLLAKKKNIPLIIDCAYGLPFPGVVYDKKENYISDNTILVFSLAKLGLPGCRTGIIVADEFLIETFNNANVAMNLSTASLGPGILTNIILQDELIPLCRSTIMPFYKAVRDEILDYINHLFKDINYRIHVPEGAFFLWIWFEDLPISSTDFYEILKRNGTLVIPGEYFFHGLKNNDYVHAKQCIRVSYTQSVNSIKQGLKIVYEQYKNLFIN